MGRGGECGREHFLGMISFLGDNSVCWDDSVFWDDKENWDDKEKKNQRDKIPLLSTWNSLTQNYQSCDCPCLPEHRLSQTDKNDIYLKNITLYLTIPIGGMVSQSGPKECLSVLT